MTLDVLHIARAPVTGVWSVIRNLAIWQRERGYHVGVGVLIPRSWPEIYRIQLAELEKMGVQVFRSKSPDVFGTAAFCWHFINNPLSEWIDDFSRKSSSLTYVHFHNAWLSGIFLPIRKKNVVSCVTYHGVQGEPALRKQPLRRFVHAYWARRLVRFGAKHITVDDRAPYIARDLFGVASENFVIVANGVEGHPQDVHGCPSLADPSVSFTVGHVGVIDEGKGWRLTAEAVTALHKDKRRVRLIIAGSGPEEKIAEEWCLRHSDFATYLGFVADPVISVFPKLDVLILASLREGLPMALLEAFSLGVPVIATPVGGIPSAISNGRNGFLIERSAVAIQNHIRCLMNDPRLHRQLAIAARNTFRQRYSLATMGKAYEKIYKELS